MKKIIITIILSALSISCSANETYHVATEADNGKGSLREALSSGATDIVINPEVGDIMLASGLVYSNPQSINIVGTGQTINGAGISDLKAPIMAFTSGADIAIANLSFIGKGGKELLNGHQGKGLFFDIPEHQTGTVTIELNQVSVSAVGNHGIHISDCSLNDGCGGGSSGKGDGSEASISVILKRINISNTGFSLHDTDGLRVDERNIGDIILDVIDSKFIDNGADGIELDEGNKGDVNFKVVNTQLVGNGAYCLLLPFDKKGDCNDKGKPDVDDGFDIDETGKGSVIGEVINSQVANNYDAGLDFDESKNGDVTILIKDSTIQQTVKIHEAGKGSGTLRIINSTIKKLDTKGDIKTY